MLFALQISDFNSLFQAEKMFKRLNVNWSPSVLFGKKNLFKTSEKISNLLFNSLQCVFVFLQPDRLVIEVDSLEGAQLDRIEFGLFTSNS